MGVSFLWNLRNCASSLLNFVSLKIRLSTCSQQEKTMPHSSHPSLSWSTQSMRSPFLSPKRKRRNRWGVRRQGHFIRHYWPMSSNSRSHVLKKETNFRLRCLLNNLIWIFCSAQANWWANRTNCVDRSSSTSHKTSFGSLRKLRKRSDQSARLTENKKLWRALSMLSSTQSMNLRSFSMRLWSHSMQHCITWVSASTLRLSVWVSTHSLKSRTVLIFHREAHLTWASTSRLLKKKLDT